MKPDEIEQRSFAMITEELGETVLPPDQAPIIKRVIHTTADFDYAKTLVFSHDAVTAAINAFASGCTIITDTSMAMAGINKPALTSLGGSVLCYIGDADVAETARRDNITRSRAAMDKAVRLHGNAVYVIGNAPTALIRLCEHIESAAVSPQLVVAVPVGFVNVVESKEHILALPVPAIVARGRKGGSNIAAAICNALMLMTAAHKG